MASSSAASNVSLKTWILLGILFQNAGYTLLRKYSTKNENVSSKEILLFSEILKIIVSIYMTIQTQDQEADNLPSTHNGPNGNKGIARLKWLVVNSGKMLVLAIIYGVMNILSFVALQYIGAGEFTICAQLKILTTAGFSVLILQTSLSWTKWRALGLLVLGCILVASPSFMNSTGTSTSIGLQLFGYAAVLTEVMLSGFASIYFEKVVKSTTEVVSIWERNFQLGIYSIIMYGGIILFEKDDTRESWSNWSMITVLVAVLGATGGLLVAATLKYADSILKTIATAGAIVISTILGHYFLNGPLNVIVAIGGMVTILSICNYTFDSS
eukprot:gene5010-6996_t